MHPKRCIAQFPIEGSWNRQGFLYETPRPRGRRIQVKENETVIFDTEDCFDLDNAVHKLTNWIQQEQATTVATPAIAG